MSDRGCVPGAGGAKGLNKEACDGCGRVCGVEGAAGEAARG